MMRQKNTKKTAKNLKSKKQEQNQMMKEWLDKTDLSNAITKAFERNHIVPAKVGRKKIGKRISLVLPEETITQLTELSKEKGIGYQTLARMFILEKIGQSARPTQT